MIISIINLKGGAGKSTISTNLAVAYALKKKKIAIIDTDTQGTSQRWRGYRPEDAAQVDVISISDPQSLKKQAINFEKNYEIVIIDGAPNIELTSSVTIALSDLIIIPAQPSPYDLWATETIALSVQSAQEIKPELKGFFLLNRITQNTIMGKEMEQACANLGLPLLETTIANRIIYAEAATEGMGILEYGNGKKDIKAINEIKALEKEITKTIKSIRSKK